MTPLTPEMIERAARAMLRAEPWSSFWSDDDARKLASAALTAALGESVTGWRPMGTAPRDGTVFDVWLGGSDVDESDIDFYCGAHTRRSPNWSWINGKFRPVMGLHTVPTFVVPTHWMPLPSSPSVAE